RETLVPASLPVGDGPVGDAFGDPQGAEGNRAAQDDPARPRTREAQGVAGRATRHANHEPDGEGQGRGARQADCSPATAAAPALPCRQGHGSEGDQVMADATTTPEAGAKTTGPRHLQGIVTRDKNAKTRRVEVERLVRHPKYGKYVKQRTICYAHDE